MSETKTRKSYTPRSAISAVKTQMLELASTPVTPQEIAKVLGVDLRIVHYCARNLARLGAVVVQGNRNTRAYQTNPDYTPAPPAPKAQRPRAPREKTTVISTQVMDFLREHAGSAGPGLIAEALELDAKTVGYHCRRLAKTGQLQFQGERRNREYLVA
ncbi:MAG: hypothetical protein WC505_05850 [Patescibacteria group bacterium]